VTAPDTRWDHWETTIREPAERSKEGKRHLHCGPATAEYQTALLPDGRWAIRFTCTMASSSGMSVPWRAFPTREEAVEYFRQETLLFFQREGKLKKEREAARKKIMALLENSGLFGFSEPEPESPGETTCDGAR
jgi:hypothetical protein